MHDDKELHLTCECHSHELHIEKGYEGNEPPMWFGSFWMRGYKEKTFGWRWRQAWHIIRTGRPYGDEVILNKENMRELLVYVYEQLKESDSK